MNAQETVAFYTLGCKVNQNETEAMGAMFQEAGYQIGDFEQWADVYVVNTCTVTHMSDRKSRQIIRRAKKINPDSIVIVTGCYAQASPEEVSAIEDVDLIIGTNQRLQMLDLIHEFKIKHERIQIVTDSKEFKDFEELPVERLINKARAYLKVQDGCEQFCSYCIIPYARGPLRSRTVESTIKEAEKLDEAGFHELILTGIHLGAYKQEFDGQEVDIAKLCKIILEHTNIERLRLSSIEPTEVGQELIDLIASNPRMCRHLHIPLQNGENIVLEQMNRPYNTEEYRMRVENIRRSIPEISISTDLIVGFPGESDEQFEATLAFCAEMQFSSMHVFKYSPRHGTPAADFANQVDPQKKEERSKAMMALAEEMAISYGDKFIGQEMDVLVEGQQENGLREGHTDNYLKVMFSGEVEKNQLVSVEITKNEKKYMLAEINSRK